MFAALKRKVARIVKKSRQAYRDECGCGGAVLRAPKLDADGDAVNVVAADRVWWRRLAVRAWHVLEVLVELPAEERDDEGNGGSHGEGFRGLGDAGERGWLLLHVGVRLRCARRSWLSVHGGVGGEVVVFARSCLVGGIIVCADELIVLSLGPLADGLGLGDLAGAGDGHGEAV